MNSLVDQINAQMVATFFYYDSLCIYVQLDADKFMKEAAAERAGSDVIFVNYDSYVGYFGGRFCEAGVDESTTESNTR